MLRGCARRIIYIRNTGSAYFDEAYFVVAPGTDAAECDMVREAAKIVDDNLVSAYLTRGAPKRRSGKAVAAVAFVCGVAVCAAAALLIAALL